MDDTATMVMETTPAKKARDAAFQWLGRFETALTAVAPTGIAALFAAECHYRDMLAFSWTIRPCLGAEALTGFLATAQKPTRARSFALAEGRTPPRVVRRLGIEVYEALFLCLHHRKTRYLEGQQ